MVFEEEEIGLPLIECHIVLIANYIHGISAYRCTMCSRYIIWGKKDVRGKKSDQEERKTHLQLKWNSPIPNMLEHKFLGEVWEVFDGCVTCCFLVKLEFQDFLILLNSKKLILTPELLHHWRSPFRYCSLCSYFSLIPRKCPLIPLRPANNSRANDQSRKRSSRAKNLFNSEASSKTVKNYECF